MKYSQYLWIHSFHSYNLWHSFKKCCKLHLWREQGGHKFQTVFTFSFAFYFFQKDFQKSTISVSINYAFLLHKFFSIQPLRHGVQNYDASMNVIILCISCWIGIEFEFSSMISPINVTWLWLSVGYMPPSPSLILTW